MKMLQKVILFVAGCLLLFVALVLLFYGLIFWQVWKTESEIPKARDEIAQWTVHDFRQLWQEGELMWKTAVDTGDPHSAEPLRPKLLANPNYRLYVSDVGIEARRGGSSFGSTSAYLKCTYAENDRHLPIGIVYSALDIRGHYDPEKDQLISRGTP